MTSPPSQVLLKHVFIEFRVHLHRIFTTKSRGNFVRCWRWESGGEVARSRIASWTVSNSTGMPRATPRACCTREAVGTQNIISIPTKSRPLHINKFMSNNPRGTEFVSITERAPNLIEMTRGKRKELKPIHMFSKYQHRGGWPTYVQLFTAGRCHVESGGGNLQGDIDVVTQKTYELLPTRFLLHARASCTVIGCGGNGRVFISP